MNTTDSPEAQRKGELGSWYALLIYATTVLTVGFLTGHLVTLCPSTGLRAANYSWTMYVLFAMLIFFALAMFASIGYRLDGGSNHD